MLGTLADLLFRSRPSNYRFAVELSTPIKIRLRKLGSTGGAHQQFWTGFRQSQNLIRQYLVGSPGLDSLSTTQRQAADVEYSKLVQMCFTDASTVPSTQNFAWLANLRNDVNYRFSGHVWLMNWRHSSGTCHKSSDAVNRFQMVLDRCPKRSEIFRKIICYSSQHGFAS